MTILKKATALITTIALATTTFVGASAYNVSWSLRQLPYAPTSESCYSVKCVKENSAKSLSINLTSFKTNNSNVTVKACISVGPMTTYLSKVGDSCKSAALKTGVAITSTVHLEVPNTSVNCQYYGNFKG